MLGGGIEEGDDALRINGDDTTIHRRQDVVDVFVHQYYVVIELSILHRN